MQKDVYILTIDLNDLVFKKNFNLFIFIYISRLFGLVVLFWDLKPIYNVPL